MNIYNEMRYDVISYLMLDYQYLFLMDQMLIFGER